MKDTVISVIIPIYNSEKHLKKCLESVCNQSYNRLEIICVNDGSTDSSPDIIKSFAKKDSRIVIINQENGGVSHSRNVGILNSTGEWISFIDSDDFISSDTFLSFIHATKNSDDFDIYMFNGALLQEGENPDNKQLKQFFYDSNWISKTDKLYTFKDCKNPFYGNLSVSNKIYKKEFLNKNGIKFKENTTFEDQLFTVEAMIKAKKIYIDNKIFYYYIQHEHSTMHSLKENSFDIFNIMADIRNLLMEYGLYDYEKYLFLQHKFNVYNYLFSLTKNSVKNNFYYKARENLIDELKSGFDIDLIKEISRSIIFFDFLRLTPEEYYKKHFSNIDF